MFREKTNSNSQSVSIHSIVLSFYLTWSVSSLFELSVVTHGLSGGQMPFLQVAFDDSYITNCFNQKITHIYFFIKNRLVNRKKDVYIQAILSYI